MRASLVLLSFLAMTWAVEAQPVPERFDLVLRGGRVLDGTGNPWYYADLGIDPRWSRC